MDKFLHTNLFLNIEGDEYATVERSLEEAEEHGFQGVEIGSMHLNPDLEDKKRKDIVERVNKYDGEIILGAHHRGHGSMCDSQSMNRRIRWLKKMGDIGEEIGALYLVTSADPVQKGRTKETAMNSLKASLREIYSHFSDKEISFTIENDVRLYNNSNTEELEFENVVNTLEDVLDLSKSISDFKTTFDLCNALLAGEDPAEFIEGAKKYVEHVHLKDGVRKEDGYQLREIGKGDLNFGAVLPLIKEHSDTVTIEHPGGVPDTDPSDYIKRVNQYLNENNLGI